MRQKCGFVNCQQYRKCGSGIQFFGLPIKNQELCLKWMKVMGKENCKPSKYMAVCSLHFSANDYLDRPGIYVKRLKPDAVPSVVTQEGALVPRPIEEVNVTNIDEPSTSLNVETDPLEIIQSCAIEHIAVTPDYIVLPIDESAEKKQSLKTNIDAEPLKKRSTNDTPLEVKLKRTIKTLRQKVLRQQKKINNMKQLLNTLKKKGLLERDPMFLQKQKFKDLPHHTFKNEVKNKNKNSYGKRYKVIKDIKGFSLSLHYHSPRNLVHHHSTTSMTKWWFTSHFPQ